MIIFITFLISSWLAVVLSTFLVSFSFHHSHLSFNPLHNSLVSSVPQCWTTPESHCSELIIARIICTCGRVALPTNLPRAIPSYPEQTCQEQRLALSIRLNTSKMKRPLHSIVSLNPSPLILKVLLRPKPNDHVLSPPNSA